VSELADEVLAEIRRIAEQELDVAPVERASHLRRQLQLDSMAMIVVAVALENRFRVCLHEEDAGALETVGDLVDLVCLRVAEQHPTPVPT
jgi:acyl carrier protein